MTDQVEEIDGTFDTSFLKKKYVLVSSLKISKTGEYWKGKEFISRVAAEISCEELNLVSKQNGFNITFRVEPL